MITFWYKWTEKFGFKSRDVQSTTESGRQAKHRLTTLRRRVANEDGVALITIVWIVLLLSIFAVGMLSLTLTTRKTTEDTIGELEDRFFAQSAVDLFFARYFYDEERPIFRQGIVEVLGREVGLNVFYESGKVNLNRADLDDLSLVFAANGVDETSALGLASAIIDWRDRDNLPLDLGAEAQAYIDLGMPTQPRNGPFESIGELQLVAGMTSDLFKCVRPLITVYSLTSSVDYNNASPRMLDVLSWAHLNSWQDASWPDPEAVLVEDSPIVDGSELGGRSMTVVVSLDDEQGTQFETVVRYKSTSDKSYDVLRPLSPTINYSATQSCPTE